jgi:hypothetical protein
MLGSVENASQSARVVELWIRVVAGDSRNEPFG